jgi:hypothetical protein
MDAELTLPETVSTREDLIVFFTALAEFLATPVGRSITGLALAPADDETPLEQSRDQFWTIRLTPQGDERGVNMGHSTTS